MLDANMYDALQSPLGRHGGAYSGSRTGALAVQILSALVGRSDLDVAVLGLKAMYLIKINESFASQALACCKKLGHFLGDSRICSYGGAIPVVNSVGSSGGYIPPTRIPIRAPSGSSCLPLDVYRNGAGHAMVIERAEKGGSIESEVCSGG